MAFDEDFPQDAYQAGNWNLIQFRLCWKLETYSIQDCHHAYKFHNFSSWNSLTCRPSPQRYVLQTFPSSSIAPPPALPSPTRWKWPQRSWANPARRGPQNAHRTGSLEMSPPFHKAGCRNKHQTSSSQENPRYEYEVHNSRATNLSIEFQDLQVPTLQWLNLVLLSLPHLHLQRLEMPPSKSRCFAAIFGPWLHGGPWRSHGKRVVPGRRPGSTRRWQTAGRGTLQQVSQVLAPRWWFRCLLVDAMAGEVWYRKASFPTSKLQAVLGICWRSGKILRFLFGGIFLRWGGKGLHLAIPTAKWIFDISICQKNVKKMGHFGCNKMATAETWLGGSKGSKDPKPLASNPLTLHCGQRFLRFPLCNRWPVLSKTSILEAIIKGHLQLRLRRFWDDNLGQKSIFQNLENPPLLRWFNVKIVNVWIFLPSAHLPSYG